MVSIIMYYSIDPDRSYIVSAQKREHVSTRCVQLETKPRDVCITFNSCKMRPLAMTAQML